MAHEVSLEQATVAAQDVEVVLAKREVVALADHVVAALDCLA